MMKEFVGGSASIVTGQKSKYLEAKILNALFGLSEVFPTPANLYFALFTVSPTALTDTGTEPVGNNYSRTQRGNSPANFDPAALTADGTRHQIVNKQTFATPTASGSWGTIVAVGIYDAATTGNLLYWGALTTPVTISAGGFFTWTAGIGIQIMEA